MSIFNLIQIAENDLSQFLGCKTSNISISKFHENFSEFSSDLGNLEKDKLLDFVFSVFSVYPKLISIYFQSFFDFGKNLPEILYVIDLNEKECDIPIFDFTKEIMKKIYNFENDLKYAKPNNLEMLIFVKILESSSLNSLIVAENLYFSSLKKFIDNNFQINSEIAQAFKIFLQTRGPFSFVKYLIFKMQQKGLHYEEIADFFSKYIIQLLDNASEREIEYLYNFFLVNFDKNIIKILSSMLNNFNISSDWDLAFIEKEFSKFYSSKYQEFSNFLSCSLGRIQSLIYFPEIVRFDSYKLFVQLLNSQD